MFCHLWTFTSNYKYSEWSEEICPQITISEEEHTLQPSWNLRAIRSQTVEQPLPSETVLSGVHVSWNDNYIITLLLDFVTEWNIFEHTCSTMFPLCCVTRHVMQKLFRLQRLSFGFKKMGLAPKIRGKDNSRVFVRYLFT